VYTGSTASGTVNEGVTPLTSSGQISGVGGSYTPVGGTALQLYRIINTNQWSTFLNQYGVWGDINRSSTFTASYTTDVPEAGSFTLFCSASCSTTITLDGSPIITVNSPTSTSSVALNLAAGSHTFGWSASGSAGVPNAVGVIVKDSNDNIVYNSTVPPNVTYDSVAQEIILPKGGAWFTGVTRLKLDNKASTVDDYYVGSTLSITSKFLYEYTTETATYVPPPPGGGRGGGGCFTEDTVVMIDGGKKKKISEIKVGDRVLNWDKTEFNTVRFIEKIMDTELEYLYAPTKKDKPFATINHPIYMNGELCSPMSDKLKDIYPWLKTKQIEPAKVVPAEGKLVYNLWVDGDGTYTVNGYGTTSIIGDGGVLRIAAERGVITDEYAAKLLMKFIGGGKNTVYGAYILNKFFGRVQSSIVTSIMIHAFKDDTKPVLQKTVLGIFNVVGRIAGIINNK